MKYLLAAALFICAASPAFSQQPTCNLKLTDAPELRGFKLGMVIEDVQAKLTRRVLRGPDELGVLRLYLSEHDARGVDVSGVDRMSLMLLDGKLAAVTVNYGNQTKWSGVGEFAVAAAEGLKLPSAWKREADYLDKMLLDCGEFRVMADLIGDTYPILTIEQKGLTEELKKRQVELEEKRRKKFKP